MPVDAPVTTTQNGDAVITTPPTRRTDVNDPPVEQTEAEAVPAYIARTAAARLVTAAQVDQAVMQLRERPGQTPVEQVKAVLRALDLTVAGDPGIPGQR